MRILQCGVAFSPNVGDGLIASCMAYAVGRLLPGATLVSLDLAGRTGFAEDDTRSGLLGRTGALRLLSALPGTARRTAVRFMLERRLKALEPEWSAMVAEADVAIIGGGQLFADADLNFPLKIGRLTRLLAERRLPVAIHAAGATGHWSAEGSTLFEGLGGTTLRSVGLRDTGSIGHWEAQAAFGPEPTLTLDPGLLTGDAFPAPGPEASAPIGLGIADATLLAYHAEGGVAGGGVDFQARLAGALAKAGYPVLLFCNGAEEDARALDQVQLHPALAPLIADGQVTAAPRPLTPEALARTVARCRGIVAHRLHAIIAAYAYGLPALALGWDAKVASFHREVGREAHTLTDPEIGPVDVAAAARAAMADPVPEAKRAAMAARALADMATTLQRLGLPAAHPAAAEGGEDRVA
ncbi:MAG: polysaccharide pyruvyl transferase family protein [Pseudomonadota bacterium]